MMGSIPPEKGFARGGHVDPSAHKNDSAAGSSGKVKSERGTAKGHQLGMRAQRRIGLRQ